MLTSPSPLQPMDVSGAPPRERPLSGPRKYGLIAAAVLTVGLFYGVATLAMAALVVLLAAELAVFVAAARFGMVRFIVPFVKRHSGLLLLIGRSAWLQKPVEFRLEMAGADAPALFAMLRDLSARFRVSPPEKVVLEMQVGAWVHLRGLRRGAKATSLGLGYDLLAGLTQRELEAVLAHEMAHAKFVHRGVKWLVNGGVGRAVSMANALSAVAEQHRRTGEPFAVAEWLLWPIHRLARTGARMVAAYSRQDEFEADAGAAQLCGSAPLRSALEKVDRIARKTARISWTERVTRLQHGGGFAQWLSEQLDAPDTVESDTVALFNAYATHPSFRDRIAALPPDDGTTDNTSAAIAWLERPDELAVRLVAEIQRVARGQEDRSTAEQRKWLRRVRRQADLTRKQGVGVLLALAGLVVAIIGAVDETSALPMTIGVVMVFGGIGVVRWGRYRDALPMPVPTFEALRAAADKREDQKTLEQREGQLRTEVEALAPFGVKKRERVRRYAEAGRQALGDCDYLRAYVAARLIRDLDQDNLEGLLLCAVASAGVGAMDQANGVTWVLMKKTALRSTATLWSAAWVLLLMGQHGLAAPMLRELLDQRPDDPTFLALLAVAERGAGKLQTALEYARRSHAAAPHSTPRIEAYSELLVSTGEAKKAETLLNEHLATVEENPAMMLAMARLALLRSDAMAAERWVNKLKPVARGNHLVDLGACYETARADDTALAFYGEALQSGFYPAAELGRARIAARRNDRDAARSNAYAALNMTRELGPDAAGPLALFIPVLTLLLSLETPTTDAKGWVTIMSGNRTLGCFSGHGMLIYAQTEAEAETFVRHVYEAAYPGKKLGPVDLVTNFAPHDRQPVGVVRPGIQHLWRH